MQADGTIVGLDEERHKGLIEAIARGEDPQLVEVPDEERAEVMAMNRHDRRAWYARRRKQRRRDAQQRSGDRPASSRPLARRVRGRRGQR